jgi:negative regulator of flagellin synthesis FlgM
LENLMKIGQPNHGAVAGATTSGTGAAKPGTGAAAGVDAKSQSPGVAVSVSEQARSLSSAQRTDAEMDMDKVKAVAEAIQNGTFKVNPEAIADKLLANAQEMLQGRMH